MIWIEDVKDKPTKCQYKPSDWLYCSDCNRDHHPKNCEQTFRQEVKICCTNSLTGGYLDPYEYVNRTYEYLDWKCPSCGKVLKSMYLRTVKEEPC